MLRALLCQLVMLSHLYNWKPIGETVDPTEATVNLAPAICSIPCLVRFWCWETGKVCDTELRYRLKRLGRYCHIHIVIDNGSCCIARYDKNIIATNRVSLYSNDFKVRKPEAFYYNFRSMISLMRDQTLVACRRPKWLLH